MFETVRATVSFSRGLFGKPRDDARIEQVLKDLSLWDKRDAKIMQLSGGMKRRVLIAKALAHDPRILFLDEPTAGVDVELRRDMWKMVRALRKTGVTIILTTHYIEEAEEMADRVGVIAKGKLVLVEEKHALMQKLGKKRLIVALKAPLAKAPEGFEGVALEDDGKRLVYTYDARGESRIGELLAQLDFSDLETKQSSLEEIFVSLVHDEGKSS
jgi:ABC-2 type transport system ATP-binding protein